MKYTQWFSKETTLTSADGKNIEIWTFNHQNNELFLSEWAKHLRNQYNKDEWLDKERHGTGLSRKEYLLQHEFPDAIEGLGPATRSGDFGELLIADFLEYIKGFYVPRVRYDDKKTRNSSPQGTDVVGFKIFNQGEESKKDILIAVEVKTQFSGNSPYSKIKKKTKEKITKLQEIVNDSNKDITRVSEFLSSTKKKYIRNQNSNNYDEYEAVIALLERFQEKEKRPYTEINGAAALFDENTFYPVSICRTDTLTHKNNDNLIMYAIKGKEMLSLVKSMYERAANEA